MPPSHHYQRRPPRRPTFLWQGTLILLPAVLLSVIGLQSLKQDRALAEHQAIEQAKALAKTISQRLTQEISKHATFPEPAVFAQAVAGHLYPEDDPVMQASRHGSLAFLLGTAEDVIYPEAWPGLPSPEPIDTRALDESQRAIWNDLQDALAQEGGIPSRYIARLEAFLAARPQPRLAALAKYRVGLACEHAHIDKSAQELFAGLSEIDNSVHVDNGFPLALFARVHLLRTEGPDLSPFRKKGLNELCCSVVAAPTLLTSRVLLWCESLDAEIPRRWREVLANHERSRKASACFAARGNRDRIELDGETYLLFSQPLGEDHWITALPQTVLENDAAQLLKTVAVPEQFAATVSLAGIPLCPAGRQVNHSESLTATVSEIALDRSPVPLAVRIDLADPVKFYAAQRSRTFRFAFLIGLSGVAVLVGFLTAWRAFVRQQRLNEMKTNFVSSVSHELRAPIASVRLMAQELELDSTPDRLRTYLRFIVQESLRLSAVIENVLDFSRREQGRDALAFESTDLVRLVHETVSLMQRYAEGKNLTLTVEVIGESYDVEADGAALQRLVVNLVDNAIKHSPENEIVRIGLEFQPTCTVLSVEDRGPGIPKGEQRRIFERFYRIGSELRRNTQGVGLGLSIVKYIAERHSGVIQVRSEPGHGSCFTLNLPRTRPLANLSSHDHEQPYPNH
jgi:signal transduction histidine kinase